MKVKISLFNNIVQKEVDICYSKWDEKQLFISGLAEFTEKEKLNLITGALVVDYAKDLSYAEESLESFKKVLLLLKEIAVTELKNDVATVVYFSKKGLDISITDTGYMLIIGEEKDIFQKDNILFKMEKIK